MHGPGESELLRCLAVREKVGHERNIANTRFPAPFNSPGIVRALKRPINDRHIHLHTETIGKVVAGEDLRDSAVQMLVQIIRPFMAVLLQRAIVGKLFGHAQREALFDFTACLHRGINGTQITGHCRSRHDAGQNGQTDKFHSETPRLRGSQGFTQN